MNYDTTSAPGFSLATASSPDTKIITAYISVDTHEVNSLTAQSESLMYPDALMSGAGDYDRASFLQAVNSLGASIHCTITNGVLTITLKSTTAVFPKLLKLVTLMLETPTFAKTETKRIQDTIVNELHTSTEDSKAVAYRALKNKLYGTADRRHSASPQELTAAVLQTTMKQLKQLHQRVLQATWTCSAYGSPETISKLEKLVARIKKPQPAPATMTSTHKQNKASGGLNLTNIPSRSNIDFSIGTPVPITLHHPDYAALAFATGVLGIPGFAGRLMSTVREKEGLTYTSYAFTEGFSGAEQGHVRIFTFFTPATAKQGLTSTFREIKTLFEKGITAAEHKKFQQIFATRQALLQDSPFKILGDVHAYHLAGFTLEEMKHHKDKLLTVSLAEVNDVIKKYFQPSNFTVAGAGPINNVKKDLLQVVKKV